MELHCRSHGNRQQFGKQDPAGRRDVEGVMGGLLQPARSHGMKMEAIFGARAQGSISDSTNERTLGKNTSHCLGLPSSKMGIALHRSVLKIDSAF